MTLNTWKNKVIYKTIESLLEGNPQLICQYRPIKNNIKKTTKRSKLLSTQPTMADQPNMADLFRYPKVTFVLFS
jgi:hypothetical protein